MEPPLLLTGALILAGGILGGALARWLRLPSLTGYLAAGILLGHHGLDRLPAEHVELFGGPVNDLAMALVLFALGGEFRFDRIRPLLGRVLALSLVEGLACFLLVAVAAWFVLGSLPGAVLLGVMAIAVAPATTLLVLREYDASGPVTDLLRLLTALSNVWAVFLFEIALLVLVWAGGGGAGPGEVAWDLVGSLLFGLIAGHLLILLQERFGHGSYSLPLLAVLLATIGACQLTGVPHMLAFLATGAVVVNRSRWFEPITREMDLFAQPAYVAFFVLGGVHLDFSLVAANAGAVALYVLARSLGKVGGARLGLALGRPPGGGRSRNLGMGLLCQAGAAIALAQLARAYDPALGERLLNIILGAVVVFELAGPVLVRRTAVAAGEVSIGHLLVHSADERERTGAFALLSRVVRGRRRRPDELAALTVGRIMRVGIPGLAEQAGLAEILRYANHVPLNQFPVVAGDGRLIGMIRLRDLDELVYDPAAASLVIAGDLTSLTAAEASIPATAGLAEAAAAFAGFPANHLAVVDGDDGRYLGIVDRSEVMRLMAALSRRREGGPGAG
ncbi:MAG: CBS domain-containing protein [Planctomycetota bacterium]|nr:MAG: CBS domain-containing protein [Planctomycetota bacterium]